MRPNPLTAASAAFALALLLCPVMLAAQDGPEASEPPAADASAGADPAPSPDPVREGALEEAGSPEATEPAPGTPAPGSGPLIHVLDPGPMYNAGVSEPGTVLVHDFILENRGGDPLSITSVMPGCSCTVAGYDSFISPGRTGKISVSLDIYREWAGQEYLKVVTVISNDRENPRMRLAIKGRVGMGMSPPVSGPGPGGVGDAGTASDAAPAGTASDAAPDGTASDAAPAGDAGDAAPDGDAPAPAGDGGDAAPDGDAPAPAQGS